MQTHLPVPQPPQPLAARMRPRTLAEYIGQDHILGPGRLLRRAIEADRISSLLFYGPPGTGKTTLARVIAGRTRAHFTALNAVLAGVKDLREAVAAARGLRQSHGRRTILFVDEVHRFNKAQQDALLPWVENGTVILIGATTENPYFEVNKALVSRSRVFQLRPLTPDSLRAVLAAAIADPERGYGTQDIRLTNAAAEHLVDVASGDARAALNALELAAETTEPDAEGAVHITLSVAEESIQQRAVLYDREGDAHFDTISAFIKSVRGGDPDAALYWLARMVYAGEDPRFIFRRLIILASEDIGLADPHAVTVVTSCAAAFDRIGMPEGRFPLAQATLYLAATDKSNSTLAFFDALKSVRDERADDVPVHLKDPSRDRESLGHGEGYLYPHSYRDHWTAQQYLPDTLRGRVFWQPSDQGWEGGVGPRIARHREAQLSAMIEGGGRAAVERLTTGPADPRLERWLQRTASRLSARLAAHREAVFAAASLQRHHLVLDANAATGLLTFEALRQAPEGGVWSWCPRPDTAAALSALAAQLPELGRPAVIGTLQQVGEVRFDRIIGRDVLSTADDPAALLADLNALLRADGALVLLETLPRRTQRLSELIDGPPGWAVAEAAIYSDAADPLTRWTAEGLSAVLTDAGLSVSADPLSTTHSLHITEHTVSRWLSERSDSYASRLSAHLSSDEQAAVAAALSAAVGRTLPWRSQAVVLSAARPREPLTSTIEPHAGEQAQ
ncbi:MAG: AAA family ATPase [Myxococcota bacterium]|nr:AAA family ATPase [Myxococcota bacterium]